MKWMKVQVPDEFDPETDKIYLKNEETCPIWEPIYHNVLDSGFVGLIDFMGEDAAVVNAARVSYGRGTRRVSEDRGLIRYLMRNQHSTPFEMIEIKWHIKAPIFVFRQWHRHRSANINEYSGRYSILGDEMYMPDASVLAPQSQSNKQGRAGEMSEINAYAVQLQLEEVYDQAGQAYHYLLGETDIPSDSLNNRRLLAAQFAIQRIKDLSMTDPDWDLVKVTDEMIDAKIEEVVAAHGIAFTDAEFREDGGLTRELARICLPLSTYSEMYWKNDLHNTFHFLKLRCDEHAQEEIRVYAREMLEMLKPLAPLCLEAFVDYHLEGMQMSRMERDVLRQLYNAQDSDTADHLKSYMERLGLSKREINEFVQKLSE